MTDTSPEPSRPSAARTLPAWWEQWPGRIEWELDEFERRALPVHVAEDPRAGARRLVLDTTIDLPDTSPTPLRVVYPDGFPHKRFAVYAPELDLPRHQAPGGNLCILPRDARYWDPATSAADLIVAQVPRLVQLTTLGGEALRAAEDPQGEPVTTYYNATPTGGIIVDHRCLTFEPTTGDGGEMEVRFANAQLEWLRGLPDQPVLDKAPAVGQGLLSSLRSRTGQPLLDEVDPALGARFGPPKTGRWTYLPDPPMVETAEQLWDAVCDADGDLLAWAQTGTDLQLIGLCTREEVRQDVYDLAWVFLARFVTVAQPRGKASRSGHPARRVPQRVAGTPTIVRALRWTPQDLSARIPGLDGLRDATATVIGLGSLGAPLTQELVKARVGRLRLADFDHIDAGTAVRYPLGLEHAGLDKGLALAMWAQGHDPGVEVSIRGLMVGAAPLEDSATLERDTLFELLDGTDLMVSATAEHDVNRQLDQVARHLDVPRMFLWSQSGYGGVVAVLENGRTGCFHCLSLLETRLNEAGRPLVAVPPDPNDTVPGTVTVPGGIQGRGCSDKTFTANHPDLLTISIQAARVAFGVLTPPGGHPRFDGDVCAVQVREPDGTPIVPRWTTHDLPPDPRCPTCVPS